MFRENTVFVLGAGASVPYGYPVGRELVSNMVSDMVDEMAMPLPTKNSENFGRYSFNNKDYSKDPYPFFWLESRLGKEKNIKERTDYYRNNNQDTFLSRICRFDKFNQLQEKLKKDDPVSIDAFLRDNQSLQDVGRAMIIYSLLKREQKSNFSMPSKAESKSDNWYSYLFNDLLSGCANGHKCVLDNEVQIITFNYDMSFESYLHNRLKTTEIIGGKADEFFKDLSYKIDHVYGGLYGCSDVEDYGYYSSGGKPEQMTWNYKRLLKSLSLSGNVKIMYDERNNGDVKDSIIIRYKKLYAAKNVVFIGFGFDRDNLNQLGLPDSSREWAKFCEGKTIKWLNYNDSMGGLSGQFKQIQTMGFSVIESKARNIVDAYNNDFKIFLFE